MTGISRSRCALQGGNERIEVGGGGWQEWMILTQLRGGDSRNPAFYVFDRHIADQKDQLERPPRWVRPEG